jgi:hypothetical protein
MTLHESKHVVLTAELVLLVVLTQQDANNKNTQSHSSCVRELLNMDRYPMFPQVP